MPPNPNSGGFTYLMNLKGQFVHVFAAFPYTTQWNSKEFAGVLEGASQSDIIVSDPQTGTRFLIPLQYVDYVSFTPEI